MNIQLTNAQMKSLKNRVVKSTSLALLIGLTLAGCATAPKNSQIMMDATAAVQAAESDPAVPQYAQVELSRAHGLLDDAHKHAQDKDPIAADHLAYLAKQSALTATARAKAKTDEAILAKGETERARIQLAAREHEVGAARAAADAQAARANLSEAQAAELKQRADQLAQELDQLKAKQTDRGLVLTLGDVLFDTGKAVLKPGAAKTVEKLAAFLQAHPERKLQIEGFTDSVGSDSYNQELSSRRADAVKSALTAQGVDSSRIITKGYGKAYPIASNDNAGGRQLNRRVEVVIGNDNSPIPERSGPTG